MQGSDPSTYEMIQKIQTLQKRLISKTEEVVEKELLIQEKEKLYLELKHILARQPGPEVAEQLTIYQQTLKEKTKQMKVMLSGTLKKKNHSSSTLWILNICAKISDFKILVVWGCFFQSMASELNMYESQVNEYKYEIERIARELQEVKKKYFMQKKKEQQTK